MLFIPEPDGTGLRVAFENSRGRYWSFFDHPPNSIADVDRDWLRRKFRNVRDKRHVHFIKVEWFKYALYGPSEVDSSILKPGDKVVIHTCGEAKYYEGVVWTVKSNPWTLCASEVVLLEGFSGGFSTEYLKRVEEESDVEAFGTSQA